MKKIQTLKKCNSDIVKKETAENGKQFFENCRYFGFNNILTFFKRNTLKKIFNYVGSMYCKYFISRILIKSKAYLSNLQGVQSENQK